MIVYVLVAVMINSSPGRTDINLDIVPFSKLEKCQETAKNIKPILERDYKQVDVQCQRKEIK